VLIVAGLHVPVIPLSEVPGREDGLAPKQYVDVKLKVGTVNAFITTVVVAVVVEAQPPAGRIVYVTVYVFAVEVLGVIAPVVASIVNPEGDAE